MVYSCARQCERGARLAIGFANFQIIFVYMADLQEWASKEEATALFKKLRNQLENKVKTIRFFVCMRYSVFIKLNLIKISYMCSTFSSSSYFNSMIFNTFFYSF